MSQFKCAVCGYIHQSEEAPDRCPFCRASGEKFTPYLTEENESGVIHDNIFDILETAHEATKKITHLKTPEMIFETYYFLPGQIIDYHKHPSGDQIFIIMQGSGEFYTDTGADNGETAVKIKTGDYISAPKNTWHKIINTGNNILVMSQVITQNAGMILKNSR
jgi:quercetin dioxygenase-like cupin family protein